MNNYHHYLHQYAAERHLSDIRSMAAEVRRARQARGSRPLRRRVGRMLITAGEAVAGDRVNRAA